MKCVECDEEAEYIYTGNSLCKKHKEQREDEYKSFLDEMSSSIMRFREQEKYFKEIGRSIFRKQKPEIELEPEKEVKEDEV